MKRIRTYTAVLPLLALMLVIAACDDPMADDTDDTDDVETPTTDVNGDDDATDDVALEDDATDDTSVDDAATEDVDAATDDSDDATEAEVTADDASDAGAADDATTDDDTATDDQDAQEILDQAAERFADLETAKFDLDSTGYIEIPEIAELGEINLSNVEGQIERPDRAEVEIAVDTDIADIPLTVVTYNDEIYIKDPIADSTHTAPDEFQFDPAIMFDEDDGIPALIRTVEDGELLDEDEDVDGRAAYKIYGLIDGDLIQRATAGTFPSTGDVDFNVWIDRETYDVLQILAEDPTDETDSVWEMRIYDQDEPVEIDDPS